MPRVILIGMNNPHSTAPEHALYPHPAGVAGHRLWVMLDKSAEGGLPKAEYLRIFERRNLVRGDWNRALASTNAAVMFRNERIDERRVVLCGAEVMNSFEKAGANVKERDQFEWFHLGRSKLGWAAAIPHPSGRSRAWNELSVRDAAFVFFSELVALARKEAALENKQ